MVSNITPSVTNSSITTSSLISNNLNTFSVSEPMNFNKANFVIYNKVHHINSRSLNVTLFKERVVFADNKHLLQSTNLPATLKNRLASAYRCPYRSKPRQKCNKTITESSNFTNIPYKHNVLSKTTLLKSKSAVSSTKLLKNQVLRVGTISLKTGNVPNAKPLEVIDGNKFFMSENDIVHGADGTSFIYSATFTKYLNLIFGIGGWCLYPLENIQVDELNNGYMLSRKFGIISHENILFEVCTEFLLTKSTVKYGVESLRSKAISILARKAGLGLYVEQ